MKDWKGIVRTVAPALATALGGPLAGTAVREIAGGLLGKPDAPEADVAAAIAAATPEQLLKLKELDQAFDSKMAELGIELEKLGMEDRANARAREIATKDSTPRILALVLFVLFFGLLLLMMFHAVPDANKDVLNILLGTLGGSIATVIAYYYGSSASSDSHTATLGRVAEGRK